MVPFCTHLDIKFRGLMYIFQVREKNFKEKYKWQQT